MLVEHLGELGNFIKHIQEKDCCIDIVPNQVRDTKTAQIWRTSVLTKKALCKMHFSLAVANLYDSWHIGMATKNI